MVVIVIVVVVVVVYTYVANFGQIERDSGLVVKSNVAIVGPRVRFPADAVDLFLPAQTFLHFSIHLHDELSNCARYQLLEYIANTKTATPTRLLELVANKKHIIFPHPPQVGAHSITQPLPHNSYTLHTLPKPKQLYSHLGHFLLLYTTLSIPWYQEIFSGGMCIDILSSFFHPRGNILYSQNFVVEVQVVNSEFPFSLPVSIHSKLSGLCAVIAMT